MNWLDVQERIRQEFHVQTIVFYNHKGGTGKTALSLLLARYLAAAGKKVLAADYDPQKSLTAHFERLDDPGEMKKTGLQVILEECGIDEAIYPVRQGLDLIPSEDRLRGIQGSITVTAIRDALDRIESRYDYCIIDDAPSWSTLTQATLLAADQIIIPTLPASDEMDQALWTMGRTRSMKNAKTRVLVNQWKGSRLELEVLELYGKELGGVLMKSFIPASSLVRRYTDTGEKMSSAARAKEEFMKAFSGFVEECTGRKLIAESF